MLNNFVKRFLMLLVPLTVMIAVIAYYGYHQAVDGKERTLAEREANGLSLLTMAITGDLKAISSDLTIVAQHHEFKEMNRHLGSSAVRSLQRNFLQLVNIKRLYDQVRYIDETGLELIRVNFNNGHPSVVQKKMLQDKSQRYYFRETMALNAGEIFFSPFDLNVEGGEIEIPFKPMIRLATPVFNEEGEKRGIVIFNYIGANLIKQFATAAASMSGDAMILNSDGYWLYAPEHKLEWGFILDHGEAFAKSFHSAWKRVAKAEKGQFLNQEGLFTFETVYPLLEGFKPSFETTEPFASSIGKVEGQVYFWKIVSRVPGEILAAISEREMRNMLLVYGPIYLIIVFIVGGAVHVWGRHIEAEKKASSFGRIVEESLNEIYVFDAETLNFTLVNQGARNNLGYTMEDLQKLTAVDIKPEFTLEDFEKKMRPLRNGDEKFLSFETVHQRKDGSTYNIAVFVQLMPLEKPPVFVAIIVDITERKIAEKALYENEQKFRALYHQSPLGVTLEDYSSAKRLIDQLASDGVSDFCRHFQDHPDDLVKAIRGIRLLDANDSIREMFGCTSLDEFRHYGELSKVSEDTNLHNFYIGEFATLAAGNLMFSGEIQGELPDGTMIELRCVIRIIKGHEDDWSAIIATYEDITERKQLEKDLRRAQKMKAVGQLTGGIAHDFNNILSIIMGNLEILQRITANDEKALGRIEMALKGAKRGADITKKLLNFSSMGAHEVSLVSMNKFIENLKELIAKSLTASIKVETHLANDLWPVALDPGDLEDAILNLSLNARDAMPDGGVLIIETANKILDESHVLSNPDAEAGEFVMISVSDTGMGMTDEIKERVFEPFFTTKEQGKGTGLGLSMVYGFIHRSGGHLNIYSEVGAGTTIQIYLPRVRDQVNSDDVINTTFTDLPRGTETILIVEDEEDLLDIAVSHLDELGYKCLVATDSKQALKVLQENKGIELLFSDIIMPGELDGYQLALAAHEEYPELKILLASGFTKKREEYVNGENKFLSQLTSELLNKPYNQRELALVIRNTFDEDT